MPLQVMRSLLYKCMQNKPPFELSASASPGYCFPSNDSIYSWLATMARRLSALSQSKEALFQALLPMLLDLELAC
jgi:hypothetical protein